MHNQDEAVCRNMLEALNKIRKISSNYSSYREFEEDSVPFDAVMMNFIVIGEMAGKLSEEFKNKYSEIEWRKISSFRNIIAHDYFGIDAKEVWQIIQNKLPPLHELLVKIQ